jgi:hypothetical protein
MLDGVIALDIQGQGLCAEIPGNTLGAGRGGERTVVLVDAVGIQVAGEGSEVEVAGLGVGTRSGNIFNVGKDRVE